MSSSNYKTPPDRRLVRQSRPYDFVYDSTYTTPSRADFLKDSASGARSGARMKVRPVYESMFSELQSDRRLEACLTPMKPNVLDSFLPQYSVNGKPIMPCDTGPLPFPREVDEVGGADRAKYAIRYGEPSYHMEKKIFDFNRLGPMDKKRLLRTQRTSRIGYLNRGVQTDIRESETQTDPYSPPFTLPKTDKSPPILALMNMTWGQGLPFTLDDIVTIERILTRRLLEKVNRATDDPAGFEARIKLMEELEAQQWADREKELEKLQNMKMEIVSKLLVEYTTQMNNDQTMRLERLHEILKEKNVKHMENVKREYFRNLRKMERKYFGKKVTRKRNIIKEYTTFDSRIYAPLVRNGPSMDLLNPQRPFQLDIHKDFESFNKLAMSKKFIMKECVFDMNAYKHRVRKCEASTHKKREERVLHATLAAFKDHHYWNNKKEKLIDLVNENDVANQPRHSATPFVLTEDDTEQGRRKRHVVTLQKIARGRVIQRLIRNEIDESMNELMGMKLMFDMDPNCQRVAEGQMQKLIAMKKQEEDEAIKDSSVKEVVGHLEGETLNKMLDFLDKEMIRLIDERKVHALILLAERQRRRVEATEAGERFLEEEERRSMDEVFKHVLGITQATVDIFLEDMYIESSDRVADELSRKHVRQLAATINEAANAIPAQELSEYENQEYAAELFANFMIPELCRVLQQEKLAAAARRYTRAAGEVVDAVISSHAVAKEIIDTHIPPLVEEHNLRGWAAAGGSVSYLDGLIREAVDEALIRKQELEELAEAEELAALLRSESDGLEVASESSAAIGTKDEEEDESKIVYEREIEGEDEEQESEESDEDDDQDAVGDYEYDRRISTAKRSVRLTDKVEEIPPLPDLDEPQDDEEDGEDKEYFESRFVVYDEVKEALAARSLQLAMGTEHGQSLVDIFDGAREMLDLVFEETYKVLVPPPDRTNSDLTISEDTDDED